MAKVKYQYNESTLSYEKIKLSPSAKILRFTLFSIAALICGGGIYVLFNIVYDSPQERQLREEKEALLLQYELMGKRLDQMSTILADL